MNNYVMIMLVVLIALSIYFLYAPKETAQDAKKSVVDEINSIRFNDFNTKYAKDKDELDAMMLYINCKSLARKGSENALKDELIKIKS